MSYKIRRSRTRRTPSAKQRLRELKEKVYRSLPRPPARAGGSTPKRRGAPKIASVCPICGKETGGRTAQKHEICEVQLEELGRHGSPAIRSLAEADPSWENVVRTAEDRE